MKQTTKKILSFALAISVLTTAALPSYAAAPPTTNTPKEEVIYVNLDHTGGVDEIYVVNSFDPTKGNIVDFGDYSSIKNLTTQEEIKQKGNLLTVSGNPKEKFYYQGTLKTKEIPWIIKMSYRLDGKKIAGEDLAGKSGKLEINIKIRANKKMNPVYRENFALQGNLSLDTEKCENIQAEEATIANVGSKKQMSYIILPDKDKDLKITTDVTDFEMDGFMLNAIPLSLTIDDPDTTEIKDRVAELQDGAVELDDGAIELDDGATKLDDGVTTLQDGVETLRDGVDELQDGTEDLHDGTSDLVDGVSKLNKGATDIKKGTEDLSSGVAGFGKGLYTINEKSEDLNKAATQLNDGIQQLNEGFQGVDATAVKGLTDQATQLKDGSQEYLETLDDLIATTQEQVDTLKDIPLGASNDDVIDAQLTDAKNTLAMLQQLRAGYAPINTGVATLTTGINTAAPKLLAAVSGIQTLSQSFPVFQTGLTTYTQGVGQLSVAFTQLTAGVYKLTDGADKLKEGTSELRDGAQELHEGAFDLKDGVRKLNDGTVTLDDGVTELRDGTIELKDGTIELVDGTHELRDETSDIDSEIDDRIDEMLEDYRGKDFDMVSFVSAENKTVNAQQFVMKTPEISIDEPEHIIEEVVEEKVTFWDRLKNLFVSKKSK